MVMITPRDVISSNTRLKTRLKVKLIRKLFIDPSLHDAEPGLEMSEPPNFGDTLSGGIQEVSALLPLLGTEQCERHVGTALEKGYLYAAATPLSIFGSLGIVKTAFSTVLATTTRPFYGGSWLDDAGFGTTGSVSSMVTLVKGTQQYGAEVHLQRLMKEQHIDDPEMVADIEWFGWRKNGTTDGKGFLSPLSWNVALILTSLLSSLISVSPYPYLIGRSKEHTILWLFPLLRSFGSLLCVVSVQLALQIRIHHIATTSLLLMKARKRSPLPTEEAIRDRNTLLELRLRDLRDELGRLQVPDPEKQPGRTPRRQTDIQGEVQARGLSQHVLFLLRTILVVGMGMIVTGYVGCFNIVGRTDAEGGPYVWFAMEALFAMIRIALWGWNPTWDECGTGMTLRLNLRSRDLTQGTPSSNSSKHHSQTFSTPLLMPESSVTDADRLAPDSITSFPLITATRFLSDLTKTSKSMWSRLGWDDVPLIVESIEDFLAAATPYVGPLRRLQAEELKGISLYCAIVPNGERKFLCMTACRDDSRWVSISILADGSTLPHAIYTSRSRDLPGTRALLVDLQDEVQTGSITVIDQQTFDLLIDYSSRLFNRLCMVDNSVDQLPLSWTVTLPPLPSSESMQKSILLTEQDKAYIQIRQIHDLKRDYCLSRSNMLLGVFPHNLSEDRHDELTEWALILDSAVMEVYLLFCEHQYVQSWSLPPPQSRRLALEWIRSMEERISLEKESCQERQRGAPRGSWHLKFSLYRVAYDQLVQELRSLRRLPIGDTVLKSWKRIIALIMDEPDALPDVSALFAHPPLQTLDLEAIRDLFLDLKNGNPSGDYHNMITFIRSSLHRLRDLKAPSLHDRIDPWGPGSPEFSPPYTVVSELPTTTAKALADQFESVQMIQLRNYSIDTTFDTLRLLDTISPSPSLTTMAFLCEGFDNEDTLLVSAILQRHRGIICLAFEDCTFADRALIDDSIAANRRNWSKEANSGGVFAYSVGCETRPGDYTGSSPFVIYHHDIMLSDLSDLFAMIYIPHDGKVVPNLELQAYAQDITLVATLTRSDKSAEGGGSDGDFTTQSDVGVSYEFRSVTIAGFPDVEAGSYELRIRQVRHRVQYLFRKLTIDFIAASDRVEPPVEPGVERRVVPDE